MPDGLAVVTLPGSEELLRRLLSVSDDPHHAEKLYPIILQSAGRQLNDMGVVTMLQLALADYSVGLPPVIYTQLQMDVDDYISAILADNEVARDEALVMMEKVRSMSM